MARAASDLQATRQQVAKLRLDLAELIKVCETFIAGLDAVMKGPSTPERGAQIAKLVSGLELHKDIAKRFGLGIVEKGQK